MSFQVAISLNLFKEVITPHR